MESRYSQMNQKLILNLKKIFWWE